MLKLLVEFGPIAVFFATYKYADIFKATLYMVIVNILALGISYLIDRKISIPLMITGVVLLLSGSITLLSGDASYIKMKPTIVYCIFGAILYIGHMLKRPLIKPVLGSAFNMTEVNWLILSRRFAFYFFTMAIINEIVWRSFSENFWVNFKVFGAVPITLLFIFSQAPFLIKSKTDDTSL